MSWAALEAFPGEFLDLMKSVEGLRAYPGPTGGDVDPPCVVLAPPSLRWELMESEPSSARFLVHLVAAFDDRALPRLLELLPSVTAQVDAHPIAVVLRADPGTYPAGRTELPAYEIEIEVAL
jgi:hypothetical protein